MKIRDKLQITFITIALTFGLFGYFEHRQIAELASSFQALDTQKGPSLTVLLEMLAATRGASIKAMEYSMYGDHEDREKAREALQALRTTQHKLTAPNLIPSQSAELLTQQVQSYIKTAETYLQLTASKQSGVERLYLEAEDLRTARKALIQTLDPLIEQHYEKLGQAANSTTKEIRTAGHLQIISIILAMLIPILAATLLARSISTPLARLSNLVSRFGQGEGIDTKEIPSAGSQELHQLGQAVIDMMRQRGGLESSLKSSEAFARMLLDISPVGLTLTRKDGKFVEVNPAFRQITGHSVTETLNLTAWQITPQEYHDRDHAQLKSLEETGRYGPYEKEYLHKDGHRVPVRLSGLLIERDDEQQIWSVVVDITQQRLDASRMDQQLQALRRTEQKLAEAQRVAHIGNWELDLQSNILWWSDEVFNIFELERKQFSGSYKGFLDRIHPDDRREVERIYTESVENRSPYDTIHRITLPGGGTKYVHDRGETHFDDTGTAIRSIGTVQDITDFQRTQEALRKNEQRLALILNTLPHGIQENDTNGVITYSNLAHHRILGWQPGKLIGRHIWDLLSDPQEKQKLRDYLACLIKQQPAPEPYVAHNITQDGREITVEVTWDYQRHADGSIRGFVSVISDISERHQAEQNLRYRLTLEEALARVSSDLAQVDPDHLDPALDRSLEAIGSAVTADRSYLFLVDQTTASFSNTHEWCAPGVLAQQDDLQELPITDFQAAFDLFTAGEVLHVARPEDLNDDMVPLREVMQRTGIASLINVPVLWDGHLIGIAGFDSQDPSKVWPQEDIRLLRTIAENFAWALARQEAVQRERRHTWFLESLERVSGALTEEVHRPNALVQRVTELALEIFAADRAWLLYLGNAETPNFSALRESKHAKSTAATSQAAILSRQDKLSQSILQAPRLDHPLIVQTDELTDVSAYLTHYGTKSLMTMAMHPQTGEPWLLGIEQSTHKRLWNSGEQHLFRAIAERIESVLSNSQLLQQLQANENRLLEAERIALMGDWELDITTGRARWSDSLHKIFGTDPTEKVSPVLLSGLVHPDDWPKVESAMQEAVNRVEDYTVEYRFTRRDGEERWLISKARVERDPAGKPLRFVGIAQDITDRKTAEQALQLSQANLAEAQRIAQIGSWRLEIASGEAFWSDQEYLCLGYQPQACEASYANFEARVHPEDRTLVKQTIAGYLNGETSDFNLEHRVIWQDGSEHILHHRAVLVEDDEAKAVAMIGTSQDITQKVRLKRELQTYRKHLEQLVEQRTSTIKQQAQIIDQTHDSVVTTDLDGFITSWNGGAKRLFGLTPEQAIGQHISCIYPQSQQKFLQQKVILPLKKHGLHEVELFMQRADGSEFPAHLSLSLLYDDQGSPQGMVGYSHDISEQKKREQELALLAQKLRASNKELESFSYSVSHDLRAPLRAIDGFSLALVEDYAEQLDETALNYLQRVRSGAQHMGMLIDDLLRLSRVSREDLSMEQVNLSKMADSILQELQMNEPGRQVEFLRDDDLRVRGDPRLLKVMLENLLGNAWKFTSRQKISQISFRHQPDNHQVMYISDNGVGFDMRYADKLFGAFQRLHRASDFPGTGVGLATVQRIVSRHGGKVWAQAQDGKGATFYFSLDSEQDKRKQVQLACQSRSTVA
jgi:PAS domain S-box-containing protein